jgi:prepilin-type N-terminal cleavage/methylation domain-containing protein
VERRSGFSLTEVLIVVAVGGLVLLTALPAFANILRGVRHDAAVRQLVSDIREARGRATMSGWEYRIVGYADGGGADANRYRILGRSSGAVAWPDVDDASFASATQRADDWVDVAALYPGNRLEPNNGGSEPLFLLTFDARGAAAMSNDCFDPFQIVGPEDVTTSIRVSPVGGVRAE